MTTNQTARVLELLKRFNSNQKVCIDQLQSDYMWEGRSEKTIRRDLDVIKEYFPESFELIRGGKGEKGCYKAITKQSFENFMKPEVISLMVQTFNMASRSELFESFDLDKHDRSIISKKIKELNTIYEFKNKPLENIKSNYDVFKKLENSIKLNKYLNIIYPGKDGDISLEIKPYKILFLNENFYLASEIDNHDYQFSLYRISKIKDIKDTAKTFHKNYEIAEFIKDIQTPFARYIPNYKQHLIDVKLEVNSKKAFYFKSKKFLKSQKIEKELDNANLLISFKVTQELEVEELIKKWIPFVKVIEPISLKNKIEDELKEYLGL